MSVKRTLCIVLSVLLLINFVLPLSVSAAREPDISPLWNCTGSVTFYLTIENGTAYIHTDISSGYDVNITTTVQLYRNIGGDNWERVGTAFTHTNIYPRIFSSDDRVYSITTSGTYKATLTATVSSASTASDYIYLESFYNY